MLRFPLLCTALLALPLVSFAGSEPLSACFEAAAKKRGVPAAFLAALAKEESDGFHHVPTGHEGDEGHQRSYGVMGLHDDDVLGHSLPAAARASGRPVAELIADACANVDGAAALLAIELKANGNNYALALARFWNRATLVDAADGITEVLRVLRQGSTEGRLRLAPSLELGTFLASDFESSARNERLATGGVETGKGATDYPGAEWQASPNIMPSSITPRYIVMHTTEGAFNGSVNWLTNPSSGVSAHYVIRKSDGYIKQLVREHDRAFHARCWNKDAIGIEQEGFLADPGNFTPAMLRAAADLVKSIAQRHHIPKDSLHVIGHNFGQTGNIGQTDLPNCNNHTDPGPSFPWQRFLQMTNAGGLGGEDDGEPAPQPEPPRRCGLFGCR